MTQLRVDLIQLGNVFRKDGSWIQFAAARRRTGRNSYQNVPGYDPRAFCWCITGALDKILYKKRNNFERRRNILLALSKSVRLGVSLEYLEGRIVDWNDSEGRKIEHVRAAIARAVAAETNR